MGQRMLGDNTAKRFVGSGTAGEWLYNKDVAGKDIILRNCRPHQGKFGPQLLCDASVDGIECVVCVHGNVIVRDLTAYDEGGGDWPIVARIHKPGNCWCFADPDNEGG